MYLIAKRLLAAVVALCAAALFLSTPASAQATRTWVSGLGDDANPCSRTAPCKTFGGSITKTAPGGEINCLDAGGFGAVTITKAMTILCDHTEGGLTNPGSNGIVINAGANDVVTISGVDVLGIEVAPSSPGINGVTFLAGAGLHLRHSTIKASGTQGVSFTPAAAATSSLYMDDVILIADGTAGSATTGAIKVAPGSGGTANVNLNHVRILNCQNAGLRLDLSGTTTTTINAVVTDSQFINTGAGILMKAPAGTGAINAMVTHSTIAGNATTGVIGNGAGVVGRFSDVRITGNGFGSASAATGVNANGAMLLSYGNNQLDGNFNNTATLSNGAFSGTVAPQ